MRVVILFALAACGSDTERPDSIEYVTQSILQPTCGVANCHSTMVQADGLVLDNVDAVGLMIRRDLTDHINRLIASGTRDDQPLSTRLRWKAEYGDAIVSMPLDAPMPDTDIDTVLQFLADGAPGACDSTVVGACISNVYQVSGCGPHDEIQFIDCSTGACTCP